MRRRTGLENNTCCGCCFAHKCAGAETCDDYCSTMSFTEIDDTYYIEHEREAFFKEWIAYTESFYKD